MSLIPLRFLFIYFFHHVQIGDIDARSGFGPGDQEWAYVTVRPSAHMFWWLYYANPPPLNKSTDFDVLKKPLLIWLQGGPGGSSTGMGNFDELGPLDVKQQRRNYTWVNNYNVLFIDNPVGSGFSYVDTTSAYAKNNQQIAEDLLECVKQFLIKLPGFKKVPIYIIGQSYGGKMGAEFALRWFNAQKDGTIESNLKGVVLGDSWISPIDSVRSWAPFLLNMGFVDSTGFNKVHDAAIKTVESVQTKNWSLATENWRNAVQIAIDVTYGVDFYNVLQDIPIDDTSYKNHRNTVKRIQSTENDIYLGELMNRDVKDTLGLNVTWKYMASDVMNNLREDFMMPVTDIVEQLLNDTTLQVVVYTGQLDLIVATPGTVVWVEKLRWKDAENWKNATRNPLIVENTVEGYIKEYANFKMYWINRAGHSVPRDNPFAMSALLEDLTVGAFE